jgi:2',3'-cyclic-nucleotide 2'-phosphodiesterase (5'-nucleotidase family)
MACRLPKPFTAVNGHIRFVTVNDVYELDNYPRFAAAVKEFKAAAEDGSIVVSTLPGDFLSPCTITSLDAGVTMMRAVNEAGVDYVMLGNHEFDLAPSVLQKRIKEYNGTVVNSNVTKPEIVDRDGKPLPEYVTFDVKGKRIAMGAFLLDDMSQYAPDKQPSISPPTESVQRIYKVVKEKEGSIDAFVPMVHLNMKDDRILAKTIASNNELAAITPVMLCSHDHEVYIEEAGKSLIFKVVADAANIGVVDIWWNKEGKIKRSVHMYAADDFDPDARVQAFVDGCKQRLHDMLDVKICEFPSGVRRLSTKKVRFEVEPLVCELLSLVMRSMPGVEMIFLQGGNVRGAHDYEPGAFTYADLMREFAFSTDMAIIQLPGEIIEETIKNSRTSGDGAKPFFLHVDKGCIISQDSKIEVVDGKPFDPKKMYTCGTYQFLLGGLGNLQPMYDYVQKAGTCPSLETCHPIKNYVMETCMKSAWRKMLGMAEWDINHEEKVNSEKLDLILDETFDRLDKDKSGFLEPSEVEDLINESGIAGPDTKTLISHLMSPLDTNGDGKIDRSELHGLVH